MKTKLCLKPRALQRSGISGLLFVMGLMFAGLAPKASAGGVPDWLSAVAHEPVPSYPEDTVAVELFEQVQVTVRQNGQVEELHRAAYKILRPEARDSYGSVTVPFDNETQVKSLEAWSIPPSGKEYSVKKKDIVETGFSPDELYSDDRQKTLVIPAVDPGNVIGWEYVQEGRPFIREENWWFQKSIPVLRANFVLQLPPGWKMDSYWVNYSGPKPQISTPNDYEWGLINVPATAKREDYMPAWEAVEGRLAVKYYVPASGPAGDDPDNWQALGAWYANLAKDSRQATPEIQQEVAQLAAHAPTLLEKIRAVTSFAQKQIRYVAIEIGIGGYQPHPADAVFRNRYGDCKDITTLVSTMLKQIGVNSYYVLINSDRGITLPDLPSLRFDHAILAIRLPNDVPTDNLYAVVDDPKLGKLLFFDSTDPYCPLGYIPSSLQDNYGLVVAPSDSELVRLPVLAPSTNRLLRTAKLALAADGTLSGEVQEVRWGEPAEELRWEFLEAAPKDRVKVIESFLGNFLGNFQLLSAELGNLQQYDQSLVETYRFAAANYAKQAGDLLLARPCVLGEKELEIDPEKPRKYPVEFPAPTLATDLFEIALPPGYALENLPPPAQISDQFLEYKSEAKFVGHVLEYRRSYEVKNVFVPKQDFSELKRDFDAISFDERAVALLRRTGP